MTLTAYFWPIVAFLRGMEEVYYLKWFIYNFIYPKLGEFEMKLSVYATTRQRWSKNATVINEFMFLFDDKKVN